MRHDKAIAFLFLSLFASSCWRYDEHFELDRYHTNFYLNNYNGSLDKEDFERALPIILSIFHDEYGFDYDIMLDTLRRVDVVITNGDCTTDNGNDYLFCMSTMECGCLGQAWLDYDIIELLESDKVSGTVFAHELSHFFREAQFGDADSWHEDLALTDARASVYSALLEAEL